MSTPAERDAPGLHRLGLLAIPLLALACTGDGEEPQPSTEITDGDLGANVAMMGGISVANVGLATPESVLHETGEDVYLVSNINGAPTEADGNGFISKISPGGEVVDLKWIDGASDGVILNAPKGMAVVDGTLWVADIDCVRMFTLATGAPTGEVCIEGATFLNDVTPHPDGTGILLTDSGLDASFASTGTDALYHVADGEYAPVLTGEDLGSPNGVATSDAGIFVVTFGSGQILRVTGENEYEVIVTSEGAQLDGIQILDTGDVLISDWAISCVQVLDAEGYLECAIPDLESPADIGLDRGRGHVLIPLFNANELRFVPLAPETM